MVATLDVRIRFVLDNLNSWESERIIHTASTRIRCDALLIRTENK